MPDPLPQGPGSLPCPWPLDPTACVGVDPDEMATEVGIATWFLWVLSGRQYGVCRATIRPCRRDRYDLLPPQVVASLPLWGVGSPLWGVWRFPCGCGRSGCGCDPSIELPLRRPVGTVEEVKIDGTVLDPSAYRLDESRVLVRVDGNRWPTSQRLDLPLTEPGTWSVRFTFGRTVPLAGQRAVARLAAELWKAGCGSEECALPARITAVTRSGVSLTLQDPNTFLDKGRVGLYEVDLFLAAVNPKGLRQRARVYRADAPARQRRA